VYQSAILNGIPLGNCKNISQSEKENIVSKKEISKKNQTPTNQAVSFGNRKALKEKQRQRLS